MSKKEIFALLLIVLAFSLSHLINIVVSDAPITPLAPDTNCHETIPSNPECWDCEYCKPYCPCVAGEGDCDSDDDCMPGLECVQNVGSKYGKEEFIDVCEDTSGKYKKQGEPGCTYNNDCITGFCNPQGRCEYRACNTEHLPLWNWDFCSSDCKCFVGQGDCDSDDECQQAGGGKVECVENVMSYVGKNRVWVDVDIPDYLPPDVKNEMDICLYNYTRCNASGYCVRYLGTTPPTTGGTCTGDADCCELKSVRVTPDCGPDGICQEGEKIKVEADLLCQLNVYWLQVDALQEGIFFIDKCDSDVCDIEHDDCKDIQGITIKIQKESGENGPVVREWTISGLNDAPDCYGKTVRAWAAALWKNVPNPSGNGYIIGTAGDDVTGSFTFETTCDEKCTNNGYDGGKCSILEPTDKCNDNMLTIYETTYYTGTTDCVYGCYCYTEVACDSITHENCKEEECGDQIYYCTYDGSSWAWRTSPPSESGNCDDTYDNDCDGKIDCADTEDCNGALCHYYGESGVCCLGECKTGWECCDDSDCSPGQVCCDGTCYTGDCCDDSDCGGGANCCNHEC
ncbi:MAG: hypothetical protein DRP03_03825, partial [Candidatus Aenigmatarchaeota archaeon]